ncbi:aldo/keto reductase [Spirochaeta isovalerica]|uniref:Aryl-alcohol dehydrogenase-like predicted oxidoreductase n=1 Tax=Spirochaeta isovalerica TaxID=150 RepID=A0A841RBD5_9SPIO|nr:aldo/keto reductase [Spirochaeta isovalerica]MBB6480557.1 aryl-alcohol dehydrogenase-like predicted oxidoreductase [Spirochaeta isovalerica]
MIDKKEFGKTGHLSSRTIFGAAALGWISQEEADPALDLLLHYDVNHIDVAASYGDAEIRLKPWLRKHRDRFFLATKTGERTRDGAWRELMNSLERMGVDHIDLWQFHCLIDEKEWDTVMSSGGALEAAMEARDKGIIDYIGVTGHEYIAPVMHKKSLERFDFDSILLPFNYFMMKDETYKKDFEELMTLCRSRGTAVQTIKSLARSYWAEGEKRGSTWYKPLTEQSDIDKAVHWVLGQGDYFLNTTGDVKLLPSVLRAASEFKEAPSSSDMDRLISERNISKIFPFPE